MEGSSIVVLILRCEFLGVNDVGGFSVSVSVSELVMYGSEGVMRGYCSVHG